MIELLNDGRLILKNGRSEGGRGRYVIDLCVVACEMVDWVVELYVGDEVIQTIIRLWL